MTLKLGVLVSGNGTNLQAILDAIASRELPAEVRLVLSNRAEAGALARAARAGVPQHFLAPSAYPDRTAYDRALLAELRSAGVEWVVLAGFMRLLTPAFLAGFPGRVVNIHPSLLPAFPGLNAVEQALRAGVKVTGCTVHFVDSGVDTGPIIAQTSVAIEASDSLVSLTEKIHRAEHALLVRVLAELARGAEDTAGTGGARELGGQPAR